MYLATAPMALRNLAEGQLAYFRERGFEVIAVASPGEDLDVVRRREPVHAIAVIPDCRVIVASDRSGRVHFFDFVEGGDGAMRLI